MKTIILHPQSKEQISLFEQLAKALNIPFEKKEEKSPYDPKFVKKILDGSKEISEGKGVKIKTEDLWK